MPPPVHAAAGESPGAGATTFRGLSSPVALQDKAFLMKVFDSMTVDEGKRMKELTDEIAATSWAPAAGGAASSKRTDRPHQDVVAGKLIGALEELQDFVDSIDNAKNLFVVGGFPALLLCLNIDAAADALGGSAATGTAAPGAYAACVRVATLAAEVLSTVVQNNPKAQVSQRRIELAARTAATTTLHVRAHACIARRFSCPRSTCPLCVCCWWCCC